MRTVRQTSRSWVGGLLALVMLLGVGLLVGCSLKEGSIQECTPGGSECGMGFRCQLNSAQDKGVCTRILASDVVQETLLPCGGRCTGTETCCGDNCVELDSDPINCGTCGAECGSGETCESGRCTCGTTQPGEGPACQEPFVCCGSGADAECVNTLTDPDFCGDCEVSCGADAACLFGGCQCPVGQLDCGNDGTCDDILSSTSNCGSCGTECGDQACSEGRCTCGVVSCADGEACCSIESAGETRFTCVEEASFPNNPNHCGGCAGDAGVKCPPNTICEGGVCVCGTTGAACAAGEVCCGGTECKPEAECLCGGSPCNQTCCGSTCTDTDVDAMNCGACGNACGAGQECIAGECTCTDASLALCDGACVDVNVSEAHCGACGNACAGGETCCNGTCTNTDDSLLHCGGCGQACGGTACLSGACSCDGMNPTDLQTDPDFCGDCSTSCVRSGANVECVAGSCDFANAECVGANEDCDGDIDANGCEANLNSSAAHCGACGNVCAASETCSMGECVDLDRIVQVAAGEHFTCARRANNQLLCWGKGAEGRNALNGMDAERPQAVPNLSVADVCAGNKHGCLVTTTGEVFCWGLNDNGQLGIGPSDIQPEPVRVTTSQPAVAVGCGALMSCAVLDDGTAECWGDDSKGELGNGSAGASATPVAVDSLTNVSDIDPGNDHACAVTVGGEWWCWGEEANDRVNCGSTGGDVETPCQMNVTGTPNFVDVAAGSKQSYAVDAMGQLWGSGKDENGSLLGSDRNTEVLVMSDTTLVSSSETDKFACLIDTAGAVMCWGKGDKGELGNGMAGNASSPQAVQGLPDPATDPAIDVSAGKDHACAAVQSGKVYCWGIDDGGSLGNGPNDGDSNTAMQVVGLP